MQLALEAAGSVLGTDAALTTWASTLVELGVRAGDRHTVGRLSQEYGHLPGGAPWVIRPTSEHPDLPFDGYKAQPYFHQINTKSPGLQLVQDEPFIFIDPCFLSPDECQQVMGLYTLSSSKGSSAVSEAQTKVRTSTTVVYPTGDEPPLLSALRERIAQLAHVSTNQLQATKISCYEKGQFFGKHTDATVGHLKQPWIERLMDESATAQQLTAPGAAGFLPDRICTVWIYLNDVNEGGCTRFHSSEPDFDQPTCRPDFLYSQALPRMGKVLGKDVPGAPKIRSKAKDLLVKPKAGMALVHFPTVTKEYMCHPDLLVTHESEVAVDPKYILQQFIYSETLDTVEKIATDAIRSDTSDERAPEERIKAFKKQLYGKE